MRRIRSCSASTAPRSSRRRTSTSICTSIEEAKKRDHRVLGKQLDLFTIQELAGPGLIFWHPKGGIIRKEMEDWMRDRVPEARLLAGLHAARGARGAVEDLRARRLLRAKHVHVMELDDAEYRMKPMNCPFHILIYRDSLKSYRDLPVRLGELGTVYRYERSGVMHGLLRVRGFTQDDAHIFCTPEQIEDEIVGCLEFAERRAEDFGFDKFQAELSTWDPERPQESSAATSSGTMATELAGESAASDAEHRVQDDPRRGGVLRSEDRYQAGGRDRAAVAALHGAVRLHPAAAFRDWSTSPRMAHAISR